MELILEKNAFEEALDLLAPATVKQEKLIVSAIYFEVGEGSLTMKASDRRVFTSLTLTPGNGVISASGPARFTLPQTRVSQLISNVKGEEVTFIQDGDEIRVICGELDCPFRSQDPDKFSVQQIFESTLTTLVKPSVGDREDYVVFRTTAETLSNAIGFVKPFVATKAETNDPEGMFRTAQLRDGTWFGTDSRLLSFYKSVKLGTGLKIGDEQMKQALAFLSSQDPDTEVDVFVSSLYPEANRPERYSEHLTFFHVPDANSWFAFPRPSKDLPDLSNLPTDLVEPEIFQADKSEIRSCIAALKAVAKSDDHKIEVSLSGVGGEAKLSFRMSAEGLSNRDGTGSIDVTRNDGSSDDVSFLADAELIEQALSSFKGKVSLAYNGSDKYLKFHSETDGGDLKVCLMTLNLV